MPRFEHDGISHYYTDVGQGYPLIFIHGLGLSHKNWIGQTPLFTRKYRVVTYDIRGHGGTGVSSGPIEIHTLSEDLRALCDHLGISRAVLVAYSSGTLIAESFALDHPERTAGLCLIGSHARTTRLRMLLKSDPPKWLIKARFRKIVAYGVARNNAENIVQRGFFYRIAKRVNPEEVLRILDASKHFHDTRDVSKISCPVLLVHGSKDRPTESYARDLTRHLPHATISVVEGVKHAVATRATRAFNLILDEWLTSLHLSPTEKTPSLQH
jgi:pimeloyl-ACP methyl ester carboxylesterase